MGGAGRQLQSAAQMRPIHAHRDLITGTRPAKSDADMI